MSGESQGRTGRIVVADDGSPAAERALPIAAALAAQLNAELELLYVSAAPASPPDALTKRAAGQGTQLHTAAGDAAAEIVRTADRADTVMALLTTHGRDVEADGRLGHVAEQVVARTNRPVLLVRPEAASAESARPLRRLLLPLDGATRTVRSLRPVFDLAERLGASVDALAVVGGDAPELERGGTHAPRFVDQPQHEWRGWTGEIVQRLIGHIGAVSAATPVAVHVERGQAGETIVRYAAEHADDAIVLVRCSHLEPGRARTLRLILARSPLPILVLGAADASG